MSTSEQLDLFEDVPQTPHSDPSMFDLEHPGYRVRGSFVLGDTRLPGAFWRKVGIGPAPEHLPSLGPCYLWTAATDGKGYGHLRIDGKDVRAHRLAYEVLVGPIPEGLCVLHRCDTPACIRGEHLFLGTKADNTRDMIAKGRDNSPAGEQRRKTHCIRGHEFVPTNILPPTRSQPNVRRCRRCEMERQLMRRR